MKVDIQIEIHRHAALKSKPRLANEDDVFPQFPQLPLELRRDIWVLSLDRITVHIKEPPSKVRCYYSWFHDTVEDELNCALPSVYWYHLRGLYTTAHLAVPAPAAYHACLESRAAIQDYFDRFEKPNYQSLPSWFCFERDIVRCSNYDLESFLDSPWFCRMRHLVLEHELRTYAYEMAYNFDSMVPGPYVGPLGWAGDAIGALKTLRIELNEWMFEEDKNAQYVGWELLRAWHCKGDTDVKGVQFM
ncbi:hypothetical protein VHEMI02952 [[Torrubiella] hemipterigena]|uniref:2EXR domain-containing protein n=1 Tax=[Torrubiella] hemipterigena TaxID=1531966 RepID=A0A0A1SX47_9HYPO|nr:hypothetical protein VHEMI02952 [[Torrubiella] hemipterigena]